MRQGTVGTALVAKNHAVGADEICPLFQSHQSQTNVVAGETCPPFRAHFMRPYILWATGFGL